MPPYKRQFSFAGFQANRPKDSLPGQRVDIEFDTLAGVIAGIGNVTMKGRVASYAALPTLTAVRGDIWIMDSAGRDAQGRLYGVGDGYAFAGMGAPLPWTYMGRVQGDPGAPGTPGAPGATTVDGLTDASALGKSVVKATDGQTARTSLGVPALAAQDDAYRFGTRATIYPFRKNAINVAGVAVTNNSATLTLPSANPDVAVGMPVNGAGIANNSYVLAVSGATVTMNNKAYASSVTSIRFGMDRWDSNSWHTCGNIGATNVYVGSAAAGNGTWLSQVGAQGSDYREVSSLTVINPYGGICATFANKMSDQNTGLGTLITTQAFTHDDKNSPYTLNGSSNGTTTLTLGTVIGPPITVGMVVRGPNIAAGTTVQSVGSTTVTLSQAATGSGSNGFYVFGPIADTWTYYAQGTLLNNGIGMHLNEENSIACFWPTTTVDPYNVNPIGRVINTRYDGGIGFDDGRGNMPYKQSNNISGYVDMVFNGASAECGINVGESALNTANGRIAPFAQLPTNVSVAWFSQINTKAWEIFCSQSGAASPQQVNLRSGEMLLGTSGSMALGVAGGAGTQRSVNFYTGGFQRWSMGASATAESGSNSGSDFVIARWSDTGAYIDLPLQIRRSTGKTTIKQLQLTSSPPASSTSAGEYGDMQFDPSYLYVCVGTNSWKRIALATF